MCMGRDNGRNSLGFFFSKRIQESCLTTISQDLEKNKYYIKLSISLIVPVHHKDGQRQRCSSSVGGGVSFAVVARARGPIVSFGTHFTARHVNEPDCDPIPVP